MPFNSASLVRFVTPTENISTPAALVELPSGWVRLLSIFARPSEISIATFWTPFRAPRSLSLRRSLATLSPAAMLVSPPPYSRSLTANSRLTLSSYSSRLMATRALVLNFTTPSCTVSGPIGKTWTSPAANSMMESCQTLMLLASVRILPDWSIINAISNCLEHKPETFRHVLFLCTKNEKLRAVLLFV